ncbi:MAG: hypothetical protein AAF206_11415 [Bacteroidota bacterium]
MRVVQSKYPKSGLQLTVSILLLFLSGCTSSYTNFCFLNLGDSDVLMEYQLPEKSPNQSFSMYPKLIDLEDNFSELAFDKGNNISVEERRKIFRCLLHPQQGLQLGRMLDFSFEEETVKKHLAENLVYLQFTLQNETYTFQGEEIGERFRFIAPEIFAITIK